MKRNNGSFVDTAILDLRDLNWVLVQLVGRNKIEPRVGHAAVASGTQMLVFGGVDENIYFDSGLRILETGEFIIIILTLISFNIADRP